MDSNSAAEAKRFCLAILLMRPVDTSLSASSLDYSYRLSNQANGNFVNAQFSRGATEEGSSGAPLFETIGNGHYLVGQLYGGDSSYSNLNGSNAFGRFDVAYNAALRQWLAPSTLCR